METKILNNYKIDFYSNEEWNQPRYNPYNLSDTFEKHEELERYILSDIYKYTGKISEIEEELAIDIVEKVYVEIAPSPNNDMQGDWDYCYKDYKDNSHCEWVGFGSNANGFKSAKDSFCSLTNLEYCTITKIKNDDN